MYIPTGPPIQTKMYLYFTLFGSQINLQLEIQLYSVLYGTKVGVKISPSIFNAVLPINRPCRVSFKDG